MAGFWPFFFFLIFNNRGKIYRMIITFSHQGKIFKSIPSHPCTHMKAMQFPIPSTSQRHSHSISQQRHSITLLIKTGPRTRRPSSLFHRQMSPLSLKLFHISLQDTTMALNVSRPCLMSLFFSIPLPHTEKIKTRN